jgi:hypothetical protein
VAPPPPKTPDALLPTTPAANYDYDYDYDYDDVTKRDGAPITSELCWSPDGRFLSVGSSDGSVSIVSVEDGSIVNNIAWTRAGDGSGGCHRWREDDADSVSEMMMTMTTTMTRRCRREMTTGKKIVPVASPAMTRSRAKRKEMEMKRGGEEKCGGGGVRDVVTDWIFST